MAREDGQILSGFPCCDFASARSIRSEVGRDVFLARRIPRLSRAAMSGKGDSVAIDEVDRQRRADQTARAGRSHFQNEVVLPVAPVMV